MTLFVELTEVAAGDHLNLPVRSVAVGHIVGYAKNGGAGGGSVVFLAGGDIWSVAEAVEKIEELIGAPGLFGRAGP